MARSVEEWWGLGLDKSLVEIVWIDESTFGRDCMGDPKLADRAFFSCS